MKPQLPGKDPRLENYALLTRLLDHAFRVPGTQWRFGLEAILGLLPGVGDILGSAVGAYSIWIARRVGAPLSIQARMLLNLGLDAAVGAIPLAGDLFDFAFKAHVRNQTLLASWLAKPHEMRRTSVALLWAILAVLLIILAAALWVAIASVRWLIHAFA